MIWVQFGQTDNYPAPSFGNMTGYAADLAQVCGCHWAVVGATSDEVVMKTTAHAKETHGMNEIPAEIGQKLHAAMRPTM